MNHFVFQMMSHTQREVKTLQVTAAASPRGAVSLVSCHDVTLQKTAVMLLMKPLRCIRRVFGSVVRSPASLSTHTLRWRDCSSVIMRIFDVFGPLLNPLSRSLCSFLYPLGLWEISVSYFVFTDLPHWHSLSESHYTDFTAEMHYLINIEFRI